MTPKYQQIYGDLKAAIQENRYPAGSYLPSEAELLKKYDASRDTVRKALSQLAAGGFIQKEKGKGSLVLKQDTIAFPVSGLTSFKELQKTGMSQDVSTDVVLFEETTPSEDLAEKLNITEDGMIYDIKRIRKIDGERVIYDHDWINAAVIPGLKPENAANSLYEYVEKDLGLKISFARKEIVVIPADSEDRKLLDLKDYDLLVCVRSYNFLDDATLFCYTESRHRPDKFRFIDFSRRETQNFDSEIPNI